MKGDLTPGGVPDYRQRLSRGEDAIDPEDWAGALPAAQGIAPRVRVGRDKWFNLLWLLPIGWMGPIVAVAAAGATATSAGDTERGRRNRQPKAECLLLNVPPWFRAVVRPERAGRFAVRI